MYLTAQRVVSPAGQEGINAFFYLHGPRTWIDAPPADVWPEHNPGELVAQHLSVSPPGNRVRSYLDLIAPDDRSDGWLLGVVKHLAHNAELHPLPWNIAQDGCLCRFHLEHAMLPQWHEELAQLLRAALLVRHATQA